MRAHACMLRTDAIGAWKKRTSTFDPSFENPEAVEHPVKRNRDTGRLSRDLVASLGNLSFVFCYADVD